MKKVIGISLLFLSTIFLNSFGQVKSIPEPEFLNQINFVETQTNTLKKLELIQAQSKYKIKGMGFGGMESQYLINGITSPVRLPSQETYSFVVNLGESGDPTLFISLHKAEIKKSKRQGINLSSTGLKGNIKSDDNLIRYDVKKIKDGVFEIIPSVKLVKGEYFFIHTGTAVKYNYTGMDAFCFGID